MFPPSALILSAVAEPESLTSHKATVAPALQNTLQMPSPIPCAPPVIMATCPSKLSIYNSLIIILRFNILYNIKFVFDL